MDEAGAELVSIGNALAECALAACKAQAAAGGHWTWEQPATSIMRVYKPVRDFFKESGSHTALRDV